MDPPYRDRARITGVRKEARLSQPLKPLYRLVGVAGLRLRLARALADGCRVLTWVLLAIVATALLIEVARGLHWTTLCWLATALLLPVAAVVRGLVLSPGPVRAAKALDAGAGLFDRVGTALAFDGVEGGMLARQRTDALQHASGVSVRRAVPLLLLRALRGPVLASLLLLVVIGLTLRFDLQVKGATEPPTPLDVAGADLLAALDEVHEDARGRGNKRLVHAVTDLRDRVQQIVDEEEKRREETEPEAEEPPEEVTPPPPPEEEFALSDAVYTVGELEALHTQLQMELTAAVDFDLEHVRRQASDAIRKDPSFRDLQQELTNPLIEDANMFERGQDRFSDPNDMFRGSKNALSDTDDGLAASQASNISEQALDYAKREFDSESIMNDDKNVAVQQLFEQFLDQYVAERGEQVADWLAGKQGGPRVAVADDSGMPDKRDAMAEAGFEDVTDAETMGEPMTAEGEAQLVDEVPPGAQAMGSGMEGMVPQGEGETTRGAQGAGKGDGATMEREQGLQLPTSLPGAQLEQILGQVTDDELPPEKRREVLEEIATHKIQGGLANDFGDEQGNYFQEADRLLLEESGELPPLFREYAHDYFQLLLDL